MKWGLIVMSEQRFGWNYFENEVVIRDKLDKKRMIVLVFSNFMDIPYNRKSFDELVVLLNSLSNENTKMREEQLKQIIELQEQLQDYHEIKDNWNSMVEMSTKISLRNVELVEQNARLEQRIRDIKYNGKW